MCTHTTENRKKKKIVWAKAIVNNKMRPFKQ